MSRTRILISLLLSFLLSTCNPEPQDGNIGADVHFLNSPINRLKGGWLGNENEVGRLDSRPLESSDWRPIRVPGYWHSSGYHKKNIVWYKIEIRISENLQKKRLALLLKNVLNSHEVYFNGYLIGKSGNMDNPLRILKNARPVQYSIPSKRIRSGDRNTLLIRVGDDAGGGGILEYPILCEKEACEKEFQSQLMVFGGEFFFLIFMGIYSLFTYLGNRREISYLYFGILSVLLGFVIIGHQKYTYIFTGNFFIHHMIFHPSIFLSGVIIILLTRSFFHFPTDLYSVSVIFLYTLVFLISLTAGFSEGIRVFYLFYITNYLFVFMNLFLLYDLLRIVFKAYKEEISGTIWIAVGSISLTYALFNLMHYYLNNADSFFLNESFILFILCFTVSFSVKNKEYRDKLLMLEVKQNEILEDTVKNKTIELMEANHKLEASNRIKDRLFSMIAHDLRSPLRALEETLDLFKSKQIDKNSLLKYIKKVNTILDSNRFLLENLLQWSISQISNSPLKREELNPRVLIMESYALLERFAVQKNISIQIEAGDGIRCFGDRNALGMIFRNLLSNAIKFSYRDSVVEFEIQDTEKETLIVIKDYGMGMDDLTLKSLFTSKVETAGIGTEEETGSGIGLSICKEYIEKMNGRISVKSTPGEGSSFLLVLPK
ncbi:MAG: hypothetical protein H7A24_00570 [Leptospiraceae bacterium]|nr:hypothetical protein [Leptospiraceae bacterium]MCP5510346.1 hypothetical protein [Leptospiraceae bacterium]